VAAVLLVPRPDASRERPAWPELPACVEWPEARRLEAWPAVPSSAAQPADGRALQAVPPAGAEVS